MTGHFIISIAAVVLVSYCVTPGHAVCVCVVSVYSVVSTMLRSLKEDLSFTTGRNAQFLSSVNTVARSASVVHL